MNENFEIIAGFLGSGDIKQDIWFTGIEEGGKAITCENLQEQLDICRRKTQFFDNADAPTQVWRIIARIMSDHQKGKTLSFEEYRKRMFTKEVSNFFLTELFPLPRPNTKSWGIEYEKIFGYSSKDTETYIKDVRKCRYPIIRKARTEHNPRLTICFGKTYWDEFIELYELKNSKFITYPDLRIRFYENEKIVLTPFFGYRTLKANEREKIIELVRCALADR